MKPIDIQRLAFIKFGIYLSLKDIETQDLTA